MEQVKASVHGPDRASGAVSCMSCHASHGKLDPAAANAPLRRNADLATCGGCHAAELSIYRSTYHGKYQALGKTNVPTCAFCHAGHELPRSDERSPLFAANVARLCASCHAEGERDNAAMIGALNTPDTGRYLYRKNAGAWLVKVVLGVLTLSLVGVVLLLMLQWVRVRRGQPPPESPATPRWLYVQIGAFVAVFAAVEQSGITLLYAAPGGDAVHRAMHGAGALLMGIFGSADARSLVHRMAAIALIAVVSVHILSLLVSGRLRRRLRMPPKTLQLLITEARSGVRPASAPGMDLWPLFYRLLLGCTLLMILTGIAQWKAFTLMSSVGFGAVRYADVTHEGVGRALSIGLYGGLLGCGFGLGLLGRILEARAGKRHAAIGAAATGVLRTGQSAAASQGHETVTCARFAAVDATGRASLD